MEVEIYSKENCINCNKAKIILDKFNPKILMLDQDFSREDFFEKFPDVRSFPQIVIDNKHIGGHIEVEKWLAFNKLDENF
jgi:glutaredoxin|tara:strand:- start:413 stop:652 length:240 start_codon:yes stop_codon:yes gene_type:complete